MDECECGDEDCAAVGYCVNSELDLYELVEMQLSREGYR